MADQLTELAYRVTPGQRPHLHALNPGDTLGVDRGAAELRLVGLGEELAATQELLYGAASQAVLIILQGMDTSGKDGTIRRVFTWLNPQTCRVASFKIPTLEEAAHDFLWRVHRVVPQHGMLAIFNRSHYEDVLVARVRGLVPKHVWSARFEQINKFERLLTETGTIVLKFFLHISKKEQEKRLLEREREPDKGWKLSVDDWEQRRYWDDYEEAYVDALERCSTEAAPWYIVPADHKWFRDLTIATSVVETLRPHRSQWEAELKERSKVQLAAVARYRAEHGEGHSQ